MATTLYETNNYNDVHSEVRAIFDIQRGVVIYDDGGSSSIKKDLICAF